MEKCLVIVPHQDDELVVAGDLMVQLLESGEYECYVLFTTNGDWYAEEADIRFRESIEALHILGIEEDHIILLGYGDQWTGTRHLYNSEPKKVLESMAGRRETYGVGSHSEWCYERYGRHHTYCRANLKADLKEALLYFMPRVLAVVDFDWHPDHRAISLLFEECMGEVLKENVDYAPLVLKKYVYSGLWEGKKDYYSLPKKDTLYEKKLMDNRIFQWDRRIRYRASDKCNTKLLRNNILYRAAHRYKSQDAWYYALGFCNADIVYWQRNTDSLLYHAKLTVSSGDSSYLNDFKLFDSDDILKESYELNSCAWMPEKEDVEKRILIEFASPCDVTTISFYELPGMENHIKNADIIFDTGQTIHTGELDIHGSETIVDCGKQKEIQSITIQLTDTYGQVGLTELEIYSNKMTELDYCLPLKYYVEENTEKSMDRLLCTWMGKFSVICKRLICMKVFPNKFFMRRQYPILKKKGYLLPVSYFHRMLLKFLK